MDVDASQYANCLDRYAIGTTSGQTLPSEVLTTALGDQYSAGDVKTMGWYQPRILDV